MTDEKLVVAVGRIGATAPPDRRMHQRVRVAVPIEFRVEGSDVPNRLQTSDLSEGGLYVELAFTLPLGTRLELVLWLGEKRISAKGRVATRHPQFGNGIEFTSISQRDREILATFIDLSMREPEPGPPLIQ